MNPSDAQPGLQLRAQGLKIGFRGHDVLSGLDLSAGGGELVAITGPSGTGKTTLLMILAGILRSDGGSVEIVGSPGDEPARAGAAPEATGLPDKDTGVASPADHEPTAHVGLAPVPPRYRSGPELSADISLADDTAAGRPAGSTARAARAALSDSPPSEAVGRRRRQLAASEASLITVKQRIAYVPQTLGLAPWLSASENVSIVLRVLRTPPEEVRWRTEAALTSVGLESASDRIVTELSGGQRQRVTVARALAAEPDVLLADEPTAELDADNRRAVLELLLGVADRGSLVVVATHDPDVAEACTVAYQIKGGRLADL
ncbi:MAG: ATP-binding cassette domain-containing protein [Acidimicrobiales bacterium]